MQSDEDADCPTGPRSTFRKYHIISERVLPEYLLRTRHCVSAFLIYQMKNWSQAHGMTEWDGSLRYWAAGLLVKSPYLSVWFSAPDSNFLLVETMAGSSSGSSNWIPGTHAGGLDWAAVSDYWPCSALAVVGVWKTIQWMESLPFLNT